MGSKTWWAKRQLRTAARLLEKNFINEYQYSYLAIKLGYQMMRKTLQNGTRIDYYSLGARMMEHLAENTSSEESIRKSMIVYGPYNEATVTVKADRQDFRWSSSAETAAKAAELQLRIWHRIAFRIQDWWLEQKRIFPIWSTIVVAVVSMVIGAVIGHYIK